MKKFILLTTVFCLVIIVAHAQRVEEKIFKVDEAEKIDLNLRFGKHIKVTTWNKNEVSFRAVIEINGGRLNDALLLNYADGKTGLRISADYDKERIREGRCSDCPDRNHSPYSCSNDGVYHVVCSEIVYELIIPRRAELDVKTISADIELTGTTGPVYAKTISGYVDLSWPEQQGADLSLKTISGEAYSNLENLDFLNRKEIPPVVGYELRGKVGKGGPLVHLESISGDIFLRKQ